MTIVEDRPKLNLLTAAQWLAPSQFEPPEDPRTVQARINVTDVEFECKHGALPLDREKPEGCDCWTQARARALASIEESQRWFEAPTEWPD